MKTKLENALDFEVAVIISQFDDMHTRTTNNDDFGKDILNAVFKSIPSLSRIDDEKFVYRAIKEQIDNSFDELRKKYKEWLYFGNNPNRSGLGFLAKNIEIELWALWLLSEEFTIKNVAGTVATVAVGKSGAWISEKVLGRLSEELGVTELYDVYWEIYETMTISEVREAKQLETILK